MSPLSSDLPTDSVNPTLPNPAVGRLPLSGQAALSAAVVSLTSEQSRAPLLEIRDHQSELLGYIVNGAEVTLFFTPQEMEAVRQRAAKPVPGKSMRELLEEVRKRVEG